MKAYKGWILAVAVVAIVFFSAKAVFVKMAYRYEIEAIPLLLLRMAFAFPVYLVLAFIKKPNRPKDIILKDYLWVIGLGFIGYYLASLTDFFGLEYIKASLERIILFIYPTLVIFITRIFFGRKPGKWQVVAIVVSYIGILITFVDELELSGDKDGVWIGGLLVFLSAFCYASYLVGSGWLIPKFGSVAFTSYAMIVSTVCVFLHFGLTQPLDLSGYPIEVYGLAFGMAIISTVIPSYLVSVSIKHLGASTFSILGSLGPISTIVLANIFLDESLTLLQLFGALIVIAAVLIVTRSKED
ncbi:MAG: DMT family transporter [Bacteroidota bacterium]